MSGLARWPDYVPVTLSRADWRDTLLPEIQRELERTVVPIRHDEKAPKRASEEGR